MRTIRFRVWNSDTRKMIYPSEDDTFALTQSGNFLVYDTDFRPPGAEGEWVFSVLEERDWTALQSTGLQDKDGRDIYEGDIVRVYGDYRAVIFATVETRNCYSHLVAFGTEMDGMCKPLYRYPVKLPDDSLKDGDHVGIWPECGYLLEVVGNIYENADLLPEGKAKAPPSA